MIDQETRWITRYNGVMDFMAKNHRNPSHHFYEERNMHSWVRHNKKLMKAGKMNQKRVELFEKLLSLCEVNRKINQYK